MFHYWQCGVFRYSDLALLMVTAVGYVMMVAAKRSAGFWIHRCHGYRWNPRWADEFGDHPRFIIGLLKNPMILSIVAGLLWAAFSLPIRNPWLNSLTVLNWLPPGPCLRLARRCVKIRRTDKSQSGCTSGADFASCGDCICAVSV